MITSFFKPKGKKPGAQKRAREGTDKDDDETTSPSTSSSTTASSPASPAKRTKTNDDKEMTSQLEPESIQLLSSLPEENAWRQALHGKVFKTTVFARLAKFVVSEQAKHTVYPPPADIWTSLTLCSLDQVKVVIVGQDPYHGPGQAHGLCFSVKPGQAIPPSLRNIYKELSTDIKGFETPNHGHLVRRAQQGVLLINTVWTVRRGQANSHKKQGWETVTAKVLQALRSRPCVFLLWGKPAVQCVEQAIPVPPPHHVRLASSHPSPLGATKTKAPFIGSRCFSRCNAALEKMGYEPIDWAVDGPLPTPVASSSEE